MNIAIYARFSSHNQTEQSIEGQLKVCHEYARANNHIVVAEYIDRALSGTTDNREQFQKMIADSEKHAFEGVLVYQLDRFSRNRYDSAIYKNKLKKNGVRVLSARENITDDASGILIEGVLESMAEYYSAELSQKIQRGMKINAEKCLSNGSNPGLGYIVNPDRTFSVDEEAAAIVREIFERYANGERRADIVRDLRQRKVKTSIGKEFTYNSLSRLLKNKRYIGVYLFQGKETPGGMPRILDNALFYKVQEMMERCRYMPGRVKAKDEYLLTTKLFCGYCGEMMVGYGGTSKTGRGYRYYCCKKARKHQCQKKIVSKELIEDYVVYACLDLLTDDNMEFIAQKVVEECNRDPEGIAIKTLKRSIQDANIAVENLLIAIESGQSVELLSDRLRKRQAEKEDLEAQLALEMNKAFMLTEPQVYAFLDYVRSLPADDIVKRRTIINIFVNAVYLYDDHFKLIINASKHPLQEKDVSLSDIETALEDPQTSWHNSSAESLEAPPHTESPPARVGFLYVETVGELNGSGSEWSAGGAPEPRPGLRRSGGQLPSP